MAQKRTRSHMEEEEEEEYEDNSRRETHEEAENDTSNQNMNEEEAETSSVNIIEEEREIRGPGGLGRSSVLFRISPKFFSGVVETLNIKQKKDVVDMGFDALLNFKPDYLPVKLAFWLASTIWPVTMS